MIYAGSVTPHIVSYSRQSVLDIDRFSTQTVPFLLIRGIPIVTLLILVLFRKKLVASFKHQEGLADLFMIQRNLTTYWSNFAVSRFTGYQKPGSIFTLNAVVLFGGVPSLILLLLAWAIVVFGESSRIWSMERGYDGVLGLMFWAIISFAFGIISWSLVDVPVYILRGIENVPVNVDSFGRVIGIKVIQRAQRYSNEGILVLIMGVIALSIVPIFIPSEEEVRYVLMWAQSAIIFCLLVLFIRVDVMEAGNKVDKTMGIVKAVFVLAIYIVVNAQHWVDMEAVIRWLGIGDARDVNKYSELIVFSGMAAYFFYRIGYGKIGMIDNIKAKAKR